MSKFRVLLNPFIGASEYKHDATSYEEETASSDAQLSVGAPVETVNPLGYNIDYFTAYFMALNGIIGTGIFASPASVVSSMGSIGSSYVLWIAGFIIAIFQVFIYIEFVTYFKRRSGGTVVYLEQAYPKPKFMVSTVNAAAQVILSFSTSSAVAFAQYILSAAGRSNSSAWEQRGVGVAVLVFVSLLTIANSRVAIKVANFLGFIKVVFVFFIAITGLVVLGGNTRVKDPKAIFRDSWAGTTTDNGNTIANAILKVSFSYSGTQYLFAVAGESNPKQTKNIFRIFLPLVMFSIFILYILIITAYYTGINDLAKIKSSGSLVASVFFANVFGTSSATKALDVFVALSALGHLLAVTVGQSRVLRECGRQGVLPYSDWWVTTKPWGTPVLPVIAMFIVNLIVLVAPPPGDAYNFVVDLGSFQGYIFALLMVVGLVLVRKQRKEAGLGYEGFKTPLPIVIITILYETFVIAMSFVPPKGTLIGSDVSFFYATYCFTSIGILALCGLYYYVWAFVLPKARGYKNRTLYYTLENGERGHTVVKIPEAEVEEWDKKHDSNGRELVDDDYSSVNVEEVIVAGSKKE